MSLRLLRTNPLVRYNPMGFSVEQDGEVYNVVDAAGKIVSSWSSRRLAEAFIAKKSGQAVAMERGGATKIPAPAGAGMLSPVSHPSSAAGPAGLKGASGQFIGPARINVLNQISYDDTVLYGSGDRGLHRAPGYFAQLSAALEYFETLRRSSNPPLVRHPASGNTLELNSLRYDFKRWHEARLLGGHKPLAVHVPHTGDRYVGLAVAAMEFEKHGTLTSITAALPMLDVVSASGMPERLPGLAGPRVIAGPGAALNLSGPGWHETGYVNPAIVYEGTHSGIVYVFQFITSKGTTGFYYKNPVTYEGANLSGTFRDASVKAYAIDKTTGFVMELGGLREGLYLMVLLETFFRM